MRCALAATIGIQRRISATNVLSGPMTVQVRQQGTSDQDAKSKKKNEETPEPTGGPSSERTAAAAEAVDADGAAAPSMNEGPSSSSLPLTSSSAGGADGGGADSFSSAPVKADDSNVVRWVQEPFVDPATLPIIDEKGEYIVSRKQWPTGEIAYQTPAPPDTSISPRFGYNIIQVKKPQTYWQFYYANPHFSFRFLNIQFIWLILTAYLCAFLVDEYRGTIDRMKTPGAMAGEHRGKGPVNYQSQKITFTTEEITALAGNAQKNWMEGKNEDSYIGSKNYQMKKIARPTELNYDNLRKR
jgi:hypothetical protein